MSETLFTVALPSLIHRVGGDKAKDLKAIALQYQCQVKRVRRSRNWTLKGKLIDIDSVQSELAKLDASGFRFVIDKVAPVLEANRDLLVPLETKLARLIAENDGITLHQLMEETGCTIAQARQARLGSDNF
ncbi:ribosome recycling factor family protein [Vibrio sonorensis]|uniref:ribosome recycling factor family protein n=1 Tax=Vibrio sonorensis TaxID=1004316 RepID=UPI0008DA21B4|nr:ribosome recycling factor family protein [Vibrio sonorensis]